MRFPDPHQPETARNCSAVTEQTWDVIVVGAGNAALCAALSAAEQGAKVLVLEKTAAAIPRSPRAVSASATTASRICVRASSMT